MKRIRLRYHVELGHLSWFLLAGGVTSYWLVIHNELSVERATVCTL